MADDYLGENFLLTNRTSVELYHQFAKDLPIIDYHCHLPAAEIAADRRFENLTQVWLAGDHYKWRAMRACGVDERYITGSATDLEKFLAWARTVPKTLRNPLYHWTHMELRRPFGIQGLLLDEKSAMEVWARANARLKEKEYTARGILRQMNVKVVCTTDDPADDLEAHRQMGKSSTEPFRVYPTFRADMALGADRPDFRAYLERLGNASGIQITSYDHLLEALRARHAFFHAQGCRLSDHGLETIYAERVGHDEAASIFARAVAGEPPDEIALVRYRSALLFDLCVMDHASGWVQQFHVGALRNVSPRALRRIGPDSGFDTIGDRSVVRPMATLFGALEEREALARTIVYNLNPADNEAVAALVGCFQDGVTSGKMQYGSAWWFLDQKDGIERQLNALSNMGLLSQFVGMLTDSRSFLSYPRHEYFRRILCNLLGGEMEEGILPSSIDMVGRLVQDVCYHNARRYFRFPGS